MISLSDDFILEGPNGRHQCFVFPVALDSVAIAENTSTNDSFIFFTQVAWSIVEESLLVLFYMTLLQEPQLAFDRAAGTATMSKLHRS